MSTTPCPGCDDERTQVFEVEGLDCATEVALIEDGLAGVDGVCSVRASAATGRTTVVHTLPDGSVERELARVGFRARAAGAASAAPRPAARSTLVAAGFTLAGYAASFLAPEAAPYLYFPAIAIGGAPIARLGWRRTRQGALDMNALMTVAVLGAMAIGEWAEGATTVVLFALAGVLEARSLERARRALGELLDRTPEQARVRRDEGEVRVPVDRVRRGETMLVEPGERLGLDGTVTAGLSEIDESPITGESLPVPRGPGDAVFAGSVNGRGALEVRVTRAAAETTLARIVRRVEEARESRSPSQSFVDRFARVYTPAVVAIAVAIALLPPLLLGGSLEEWTYRALVLLVLACPCALVISTPVSIVSGLTAASRRGVLIKGGAHLEALGRVRGVVFDKTGTLTHGTPELAEVSTAPGADEGEVLALAAALEARSGHALGRALERGAAERGVDAAPADAVEALPGRGVSGRVRGRPVLVGSHRLFDERGLCDHSLDPELRRLEDAGLTAVMVAAGAPDAPEQALRLMGVLGIADAPRPEAAAAVAALRAAGLEVAMITGDNPRTAAAIGARVGIDEQRAEQLPEQKANGVVELTRLWGPVAMVGDGVNDAPALATASVGIAMGGRGTDAAIESAHVALLSDDLGRIPLAVELGRATRRVIAWNVAVALGVKLVVFVLALAGYGSLWAAVAADMGASLLVVANGLRLLHASQNFKLPETAGKPARAASRVEVAAAAAAPHAGRLHERTERREEERRGQA